MTTTPSATHTPSDTAVSPEAMANAIRALAMDAVEKAASGHPGMPMGMADAATVLFTRFAKLDPKNPDWPDRDRFVLSAGHGSMLLYAVLHLLGFEAYTTEELKQFRQLGSKTAGHPEYPHSPGVETTTGPLGQGLANGVGMAMAERIMAARFGSDIVNHRTYVIASDGDLMEGISHEAISLAGHQKLNKLIVLFDDNGISIDGPLSLAESGDQIARFQAAGWQAERVDGHDPEAVAAALERAQSADRPVLIACRTTIGKGAPTKAGTSASHGAALGAEEIAGTREAIGWPHAPFEIPDDILQAWRSAGRRNESERAAWQGRLESLDGKTRTEFDRRMGRRLKDESFKSLKETRDQMIADGKAMATRKASGMALEALVKDMPELIGGSADLTGSNNTLVKDMGLFGPDTPEGRFVHYGVREHAMAAAMNGMALHGGVLPYSGTFLVFSDYCRPSLRLAALMGIQVIHVFTHDSIGVGEDGPTHQPVEHVPSLRMIPGLSVFRPADPVETAECWEMALRTTTGPSVLALTRQNVPTLRTTAGAENLCAKGGYELVASDGPADVTLIGSGSELHLAVEARALLAKSGVRARVVSMPCWELFDAQDAAYRATVLGPNTVRIAVEAALGFGWERYLGEDGAFVGMTGFGASAPAKELFQHFRITPEAVAETATARLKARAAREPGGVPQKKSGPGL